MAGKKKMNKKKRHALRSIIIILALLLVLFIVLCFVTPKESEAVIRADGTIEDLELPAPVPGEQIIRHTGYTLSYNEDAEQPSWVAYELTRNEVLGGGEREDSFKEDPAVITGSAVLADYRKSGYDRGHMAPAADFKWSDEAMSDTFFLSNMSPQEPGFNRGIWADLEAAVRTMAYDNGTVCVVTGPVLTDGPYKTIGKNKVAVPKRYYKVVLDYTDPDIKAIGFVLPNAASSEPLSSFAMSVDDVEKITGLDFYPRLPDDQEELIESSYDITKWSLRTFTPTGEKADAEYVAPKDDKAAVILSAMSGLFYQLKKAVFEYTGTTKIAREIGLI